MRTLSNMAPGWIINDGAWKFKKGRLQSRNGLLVNNVCFPVGKWKVALAQAVPTPFPASIPDLVRLEPFFFNLRQFSVNPKLDYSRSRLTPGRRLFLIPVIIVGWKHHVTQSVFHASGAEEFQLSGLEWRESGARRSKSLQPQDKTRKCWQQRDFHFRNRVKL